MASPTDWKQLLIPRYPSYKAEVEDFLDGLDLSNSNDILVQIIFESIEFNDSIPDNLKLLYAEAANGTDKEVKARMKSRVANFKQGLKNHPKVKAIDMMHASDLTNSSAHSIQLTVNKSKDKDLKLAQSIKDECDHRQKQKQEKLDEKAEMFPPDDCAPSTSTITLEDDGHKVEMCTVSDDKPKADFENYINLETGDVIYSELDCQDGKLDENMDVKTYSIPKRKLTHKKLLPKNIVNDSDMDQQVKGMKKSKSDAAFDKILKQRESKHVDMSFSSDDENQNIDDLESAFNPDRKRSKLEEEEMNTMKDLRRAAKSVTNVAIDQSAYYHGMSEVKGFNFAKYQWQARSELTNVDDDTKSAKKVDPKHDDLDGDHTGNLEPVTNDELHYDATPFYANQEEDPEVQHLIWDFWEQVYDGSI